MALVKDPRKKHNPEPQERHMKTAMKTLVAALAATGLMAAGANAEYRNHDRVSSEPATFGSCGTGFSFHYSRGHRGGHYRGHYGGHYRAPSYGCRERSRIIDRHYYTRGCVRYCRITYLHERVDHCGRVIRCWRSCRTVRCW